MKNKRFFDKFFLDYDARADVFYFCLKNRKVVDSVVFGNLVIDFSKKNEIVGIEVLNAKKFMDLNFSNFKKIGKIEKRKKIKKVI